MHVRFSTCRGLPVVSDAGGQILGSVDGILLHPDHGKVEGFFVTVPGFFTSAVEFLSTMDVRRFGKHIEVRDESAICDIDDHIRLRPLLEKRRPILGQSIVTEDGRLLGRCADVQFNSVSFTLEWLYPKRFLFWWGLPVPARAIVEVTRDAIVVRIDAAKVEKVSAKELLPVTPTAA